MSIQPPHNYPRIFIERSSLIRPCVAEQSVTSDQFVDKPNSGWRKLTIGFKQKGLPYLLNHTNDLQINENTNQYLAYLIRGLKYISYLILQIYQIYLLTYAYFYPYALLPIDDVSNEFAKCYNWSEAVIKSFAWHPNYNRCAIAVCNDYIYVYEEVTRIRVLRHNMQRKILDMAWHPTNKDILVVATQSNIIIWSIQFGAEPLLNGLKEGIMSCRPIAPGFNPLNKERILCDKIAETKIEPNSSSIDSKSLTNPGYKNYIVLNSILTPPIVSLHFDRETQKLYCCSPNSHKIAVIDLNSIIATGGIDRTNKNSQQIQYLSKLFGQGVTRICWSPKYNRLATSSTSKSLRIYEPFCWSNRVWPMNDGLIQELAWSRPSGSILLIAPKLKPVVYALPFLDESVPKDVGGNKSSMKALDLTETQTGDGYTVGGLIQSMVWDKDGRRLAISFKDHPNTVLLYRTSERPTIEFYQMGVIQGQNNASALVMEFHEKFKNGSLLTICWSDGQCQHVPLPYTPQEVTKPNLDKTVDSHHNATLNLSVSFNGPNTHSKSIRSLTSFCNVVGNNNSISAACTPILMRHKCLSRILCEE